MKKQILIVVVVIIALILAVTLGKDIIAKPVISTTVKAITGLKLEIGYLNIGILKTLIMVKDLKIFNTPAFKQDKVMADIPEIYVAYDLGAFLVGKIHLGEVRLNLKEMFVVKNEQGILNLDSLKVVENKKKGSRQKKTEMKIDTLNLKIGKVIYKDYSKNAAKPQVAVFNLNINETYHNITDTQSLASIILFKALINTSISNITNFDLGPFKGDVSQAIKGASGALKGAAGEAEDALKGAGEGILDIFK